MNESVIVLQIALISYENLQSLRQIKIVMGLGLREKGSERWGWLCY